MSPGTCEIPEVEFEVEYEDGEDFRTVLQEEIDNMVVQELVDLISNKMKESCEHRIYDSVEEEHDKRID